MRRLIILLAAVFVFLTPHNVSAQESETTCDTDGMFEWVESHLAKTGEAYNDFWTLMVISDYVHMMVERCGMLHYSGFSDESAVEQSIGPVKLGKGTYALEAVVGEDAGVSVSLDWSYGRCRLTETTTRTTRTLPDMKVLRSLIVVPDECTFRIRIVADTSWTLALWAVEE